MYNCTEKYDFLIECLHFLLKTKHRIDQRTDAAETHTHIDNNSNDNGNKSRRDHDITMAGAFNTIFPPKLPINRCSHRGDGLPIGNQKNKFELRF